MAHDCWVSQAQPNLRSYSGPNRVHLYVAAAGNQIMVAVYRAGFVPPFPQGAASFFQLVHISRLPAADPLHEQPKICFVISRINQQMHMVGHQAVCVYLATQFQFPVPQVVQVIPVIFIRRKYRLPVVAALDNVVRTVWDDYSGMSWQLLYSFLCFLIRETDQRSVP